MICHCDLWYGVPLAEVSPDFLVRVKEAHSRMDCLPPEEQLKYVNPKLVKQLIDEAVAQAAAIEEPIVA